MSDINFLKEMLGHLDNGDTEMVRTMVKDWITEIEGTPPVRPNQAHAILALVAVARAALSVADNSEEVSGDHGIAHNIEAIFYDELSEALDMLDELPDDKPGYEMAGPARAEWALRDVFSMQSMPELRPETLAFAMRMEQRLREKQATKRDSWRGMYPAQLMVHASSKAIRLESLILSDAKPANYLLHAVDLANYCLMIASQATVDDAELEDSGPGWVGLDMAPAPEWQRNDEATYHTLLLVGGHNVSMDAVASWSDEQCRQAEQWAMAIHQQASDNDGVEVPRTPDCVRPFLNGGAGWAGLGRAGRGGGINPWKPIATAPKDGTLLLLLLERDDALENAVEGEEDHLPRTVGFNGLENTGDDEWFIAGWDWSHDCFSEGKGTPIMWMFMPHPSALTCGKLNNGIPCTMPAGSKCPDCGSSLIDYHGE